MKALEEEETSVVSAKCDDMLMCQIVFPTYSPEYFYHDSHREVRGIQLTDPKGPGCSRCRSPSKTSSPAEFFFSCHLLCFQVFHICVLMCTCFGSPANLLNFHWRKVENQVPRFQFFSWLCSFSFLAVQNSSIGDLVTHSLTLLLLLRYKERP